MSFAGYSFCKPHSASYAQVSYQSAYLRAHYPAEFMAAVVSNQGGFYTPFVYLSEARRMGLTILPPDINASHWEYTGADKTIRMGFMQIKGLRLEYIEHILDERARHSPFRSFQNFLIRTKEEPTQTRLLVKAGCFDSIAGEVTRPGLLWRLHAHCGIHGMKREHSTQINVWSALPIPQDYSPSQKDSA